MKKEITKHKKLMVSHRFTLLLIFAFAKVNGQTVVNKSVAVASEYAIGNDKDVFGISNRFIENIGQYGVVNEMRPQMGKILFSYEGLGNPVLFTSKGLIHIQKKISAPSKMERERLERNGISEEEISRKIRVSERIITTEWLNTNPDVKIVQEDIMQEYHTYGKLAAKAHASKKIIYKSIYKGIDLVYSFNEAKSAGFEYSLVVEPNADLSIVKLKYDGDIKKIKVDRNGNLIIKSDIGEITESIPVSYYSNELNSANNDSLTIKSNFELNDNVISFKFSDGYDKNKRLIIDPFVTATGNLIGINAGKAKDVDFDYVGNVYISGGGDGTLHKLAKYDPNGVLLWTFTGTIALPAWSFGPYYGGWVVEKSTGNIYMGHGFNFATGYIVIRLNTTGIYDNYISTGNLSANENWKMFWTCNNGSPQILIAGGGTSGNLNLGVLTPPSTVISGINLTGLSGGCCQDVADMAIDPANLSIYPLYASLGGMPFVNNRLYKNTFPYNAAFSWSTLTGFTPLSEANNRPYMALNGGAFSDNSANILAINSTYLFYWDGKNLQAFNKASGATIGVPLSIAANTVLMQGGIEVDECNNVFVGTTNGTIKVYNFNGSIFNDAPADITIPGFTTKSVYDVVYNVSQKILYACGDGFVASFDVSGYNCATNPFTLNVISSCATSSATTTISPIPPTGSTVTYVLFNGTTQIASNTTGSFSGLSPNITYTIKATVNLACSGSATTTTFTLPGPTIVPATTNTTCGTSNGIITIAASGGVSPYSYNINGGIFQLGNSFTGLAVGLYTINTKDVNGCSNSVVINIANSNGPTLTFTKTDAICGSSTGTITANGSGGAPLTYSINGTTFQTNNVFSGVAPGTYTLTVKDVSGCTNVFIVTITNIPGATATVIPSATFCNTNNGSITVVASGGASPLQYSINGNVYQVSSVFNGLFGGAYTVTVKDANGCLTSVSTTVPNSAAPTVSATAVTASCNNANGSITATGVGGSAPLQYSINGITFQASNFFGGLTSGTYIITVKDANNCTNTVSVIVNSTGGPAVSGTSTLSACNSSTGTITASGSGGTGLLQYSINGITFQSSNLFSGLAANIYFLYVRDAAGCRGATLVVVSNATSPTINVTVTPTACSLSNGIITTTAAGGTSPYQYSINNGVSYQASNIFSGLVTGTYSVIVKDVNGCTSATVAIMTNVAGLSITASNISSACSSSNGSITANGLGGVAPLQYSINGSSYQSSNVFNGLGGGNYIVYVKDNNGCISTTNVTIITAQAPTIIATATNANCGSSNAVITATGSGGVAPLQYSINGSTYQTGSIFLNVAPGTYTVYVKDAANCIQTASVIITNVGAGPGISTFTVRADDAYPCNSSLGKITNPRVNGANCGSCTFSLNFGTFVANQTQLFLNLSPGTYTVTAMDANGCTKTVFATIAIAANSTATSVVTGTACNTSLGTITLTGIGPNTPYHASISGIGGPWIDFDPTYTFTGLAPGVYEIILSDDESFDTGPPIDPGGCLDTIYVTVPSIGGPTVTATQTSGTCGLSNGSLNVSGTGGSGVLSYSLNGGTFQSTGLFTGLAAGTYTIEVMDGTGCATSINVSVTNSGGPLVTATTVSTSCGVANGIINAIATGGTAPLQYTINGFNLQNSGVFNGLAAGNYTIRVFDAGGCQSITNVTVGTTPRPAVTALSIATSCNSNNGVLLATGASGTLPYQFSINGTTFQSSNLFVGLAAGTYTVTIKDANGCLNTTGLSIGNLLAPQQTLVSSPATCLNANGTITSTATGGQAPLQYSLNGTTFQVSNIFTGLNSGSYTVYVRDFNGCLVTKSILVASPNVPQTLSATIANSSCGNNNGSITASATGGVAPLQYSINGSTFQASTFFSLLASGTYPLTVRDANLCIKTLSVTVVNLPGPTVTATSTLSSCFANDGTITATALGGTGAITYSKNGTIFQSSPVFTGLAPGTYTITTRDTKLCTSTTSVTVGKVVGPVISVSNSPSGCGDTIVVGQTGGTSVFQYNINTAPYQTNNTFPCQLPGTYMVRVVDANGCRDSITLILGSPLPVELIYFDAVRNFNVVELNWVTASEINNDYFTVEKSKDGRYFVEVLKKDGAGNSNNISNYFDKDLYPFNGESYYRLKQTDFNGSATYSSIVRVTFSNQDLLFFYPNPVLDYLSVFSKTEITEIKIIDVAGRVVLKFKNDFTQEININMIGLAAGTYCLRITDADNKESNFKIVKKGE
jgi:Secretion system C-terminal sorting domain/SprB repeat